MTFLVGPEAASAFFKATDRELGQDEVYGFMKPVFGEVRDGGGDRLVLARVG